MSGSREAAKVVSVFCTFLMMCLLVLNVVLFSHRDLGSKYLVVNNPCFDFDTLVLIRRVFFLT